MDNGFTLHDFAVNEKSFNDWQRKRDESIDEETMKRRQIELYALVNKVIENELSPKDKYLVHLHWYEEKSVSEIAAMLSVDKTTVYRRLDKITDSIYDKLKYAIEYRFGSDYSKNIRPVIKNKGGNFYTPPVGSVGKRIKNLRLRQDLSIEEVSKMSEVPLARLWDIEHETIKADSEDIAKLSRFFTESCDFIIFGERHH